MREPHMQPMRATEHNYLTVGGRRWCMGCNTYQVFKGSRWRDGYPPAPWPGYEATQAICPRQYEQNGDR